MALTATYQASLRTLSYTATGTVESSEATQEYYTSNANRVGLLHFASMSMENKVITGISLTVTAKRAGYGLGHEKTVYIRKSKYQATSQSGVKGSAFVGDLMGTFTGKFYGNTSTYALTGTLLTNLAAYFSAGNNTLILYNPDPEQSSQGYSMNYLKWESASIVITYQEAASQPTLSATEADMGTAITITTNRQSTAATHTLRYSFLNASGTIATGVTDSASWTPPVSLAAQIPAATSDFCTIYCDTYINSTLIATKQCTLTLKVPASVKPSISSVSYAEATAGISANYGVYIRTISMLSVTITASGVQSSTISSYRATIDSRSYTGRTFTTSPLMTAGDITLTVTVTDSRGRTATLTKTISVVDYSPPKLTAFSAERCNTAGTAAQIDGEKVRITATASIASISGKNKMTAVVYYRLTGAETWATALDLAPTTTTLSAANQLLTPTFDTLRSYEIKLRIMDAFCYVEQTAEIGTKQVLIDLYHDGTGIAFGKVAETAGVADFGWPLKLSAPLGIDQGGTGASTVAGVCEKLGVVKKTGDTMTGNLNITSTLYPSVYLLPTSNSTTNRTVFEGSYLGASSFAAWQDSTGNNRRMLEVRTAAYQASLDNAVVLRDVVSGTYSAYRIFHAGMATAIPIANGGTGASTASAALQNLGVFYAETLPESGTDGQICLVPV